MQYGGDEVGAVVLDIGSYAVRAGSVVPPSSSSSSHVTTADLCLPLARSYAGEDAPKAVFPSAYAAVPTSTPDAAASASYIHGNSAHLYRPHAAIHNFVQDGIVADWDAASRAVEHAFAQRLRLDSLEEYPLLATEASWNPKENKELLCELAFEKWNAPAYYAVDKAVMSASVQPSLLSFLSSRRVRWSLNSFAPGALRFAAGKGSALVIDIGDELMSITPVYDGFVLRKGEQRARARSPPPPPPQKTDLPPRNRLGSHSKTTPCRIGPLGSVARDPQEPVDPRHAPLPRQDQGSGRTEPAREGSTPVRGVFSLRFPTLLLFLS